MNSIPQILISSIVAGSFFSVFATSILLIYRSGRFINLAQGVSSALAIAVSEYFRSETNLDQLASLALGLLSSVLIGLVMNFLVLSNNVRRSNLYVIGSTLSIAMVALSAINLLDSRFGLLHTPTKFSFLSGVFVTVFQAKISWIDLVFFATAIGYVWFVKKSPGSSLASYIVQADIDSPKQASRLGISVSRVFALYWIISSLVPAFVGLISLGTSKPSLPGSTNVFLVLVVPLCTVAVVGSKNVINVIPVTFFIAFLDILTSRRFHWHYLDVVALDLLIAVVGAILVNRNRVLSRAESTQTIGRFPTFALRWWPQPNQSRTVASIILGVLILVTAVTLSGSLPDNSLIFITYCSIAIVFALSAAAAANWSISMGVGQFAIGLSIALLMITIENHFHIDAVVAVLVGALLGTLLSLVLALAVSNNSLELPLITTFLLVIVAQYWINRHTNIAWLDSHLYRRPEILGAIELNTPYRLLLFSLVCLVICTIVATNIKTARPGRQMALSKDNRYVAPVFGVGPIRANSISAAFAGSIAGIGGTLWILTAGSLSIVPKYTISLALSLFLACLIGGVSSSLGVIFSGLIFETSTYFLSPTWQSFILGVLSLVTIVVLGGPLDYLVAKSRIKADQNDSQYEQSTSSTEQHKGFESLVLRQHLKLPIESKSLKNVVDEILGIEALERQMREKHPLGATIPASFTGGDRARLNNDPHHTIQSELMGSSSLEYRDGSRLVLRGIDFSLFPGEIVGIVGANGSGKSTFLEVFAGDKSATSGIIRYQGKRLHRLTGIQRANQGLIACFRDKSVFPSLTVAANLQLATWMLRKDKSSQERGLQWVLEIFPVLAQRLSVKAGDLSSGERQMLCVAQSLLCRPRVLLIDELSQGLSPNPISQISNILKELARAGVGIVLAEQSFNLATSICDRVILMENGQIAFAGPPPELITRQDYMRSVFLRSAQRRDLTEAEHTSTTPPSTKRKGEATSGMFQTSALSGRNISKSFGGIKALDNVSFSAYPGQVLGIIGSNGSGKTTLLDICSGISLPATGQIRMLDHQVTFMPTHQRATMGMARSFQNSDLFPNLTPFEVLAAAIETPNTLVDPLAYAIRIKQARHHEKAVKHRTFEVLEEFGIEDIGFETISSLSNLHRRLLELACVLASKPRIVLLDEPTVGVSQRQRGALGDLLQVIKRTTRTTIVMVEHDIPLISQLADSLVCLHLGKVISSGTPSTVLRDKVVLDSYLGVLARSPVGNSQHQPSKS